LGPTRSLACSAMAQPGGSGPVGPYPARIDTAEQQDEYDKLRRRVLWRMPSGLYVIGSTDGADRRNGMTANWVTQVSFLPKLVAVGIEQDAFTHGLIAGARVFSVNMISVDDRALVRKFTKPVEVDLTARTMNGIAFHDGTTGAPILDDAVAFFE